MDPTRGETASINLDFAGLGGDTKYVRTVAQAAKFWPLYTEYKTEQEAIGNRSWKALTSFAENYDKLGEETSKAVLDDWLGAREEQAKLAKKWRGKFTKTIGEKKTLRFYQIEAKLDQIIQGEILQAVPLAY